MENLSLPHDWMFCASQVSQPSVVDSFWLWTRLRPGLGPRAAGLQEAAPPAPGKLLPRHWRQPGGRGAPRAQFAESHGRLLPEHHSGRAAGHQGEEARHPAECSEERWHDPGQKARSVSTNQECPAESASLFRINQISRCVFSPLFLHYFYIPVL